MSFTNLKLRNAVEMLLLLNDHDPEENPEYWRGGYELLANLVADDDIDLVYDKLDHIIANISHTASNGDKLTSVNNFNGLRVEYINEHSSVLFSSHESNDDAQCVALLELDVVEKFIAQMRTLVSDIRAGVNENRYGSFSGKIGTLHYDYSTDTPDDIEFCTTHTSLDDKRNVYLSTATVSAMCEVLSAVTANAMK